MTNLMPSMAMQTALTEAIQKRQSLISPPYNTAFRLLNGFSEGIPDLVLEVFGKTLVCHDYGKETENPGMMAVVNLVLEQLPWVVSVLVKHRHASDAKLRNGHLVVGTKLDKRIVENGVHYAVDLRLNRDTSFYLDTQHLREWVKSHLKNKDVLNTFAYTGSIGMAALVGGARSVMHLDLNPQFLTLAKRSALLNGFPVEKSQYQTGDFWSRINQYKKSNLLFDCVILDPPIYAKTPKGTIDLRHNYDRIINKVRPLIRDGGYLITINNALYLSGEAHQAVLSTLCQDGYLSMETIIPVPEACVGDADALKRCLPEDPAPYNHPTKITILRVKRK